MPVTDTVHGSGSYSGTKLLLLMLKTGYKGYVQVNGLIAIAQPSPRRRSGEQLS
jgi:hypothetical protein